MGNQYAVLINKIKKLEKTIEEKNIMIDLMSEKLVPLYNIFIGKTFHMKAVRKSHKIAYFKEKAKIELKKRKIK